MLLCSGAAKVVARAWPDAAAAFERLRDKIHDVLTASRSGRELIDLGYPEDVDLASEVDVDEAVPLLGESIDIPLRCRHRIENRGPGELHMIEVWLGTALREDDIVRFEDRYGRC